MKIFVDSVYPSIFCGFLPEGRGGANLQNPSPGHRRPLKREFSQKSAGGIGNDPIAIHKHRIFRAFSESMVTESLCFEAEKRLENSCFLAFSFGGERMTGEHAERIKALRIQGKGYKAIASALGLSRDIVRNYCKANGLDGYGEFTAVNLRDDAAGQSE